MIRKTISNIVLALSILTVGFVSANAINADLIAVENFLVKENISFIIMNNIVATYHKDGETLVALAEEVRAKFPTVQFVHDVVKTEYKRPKRPKRVKRK